MIEIETSGSDKYVEVQMGDTVAQRDDVVRLWRQDNVLLGFVVIISLASLGLLFLLAVPLLANMQVAFGADLPAISALDVWLRDGPKGLIPLLGLALLAVVAFLLLRFHVQQNLYFYSVSGCPQCREHDLLRVRRQRRDRFLGSLGFPLLRYECRNCTWAGTRLNGIDLYGNYDRSLEADEQDQWIRGMETSASQDA